MISSAWALAWGSFPPLHPQPGPSGKISASVPASGPGYSEGMGGDQFCSVNVYLVFFFFFLCARHTTLYLFSQA